MPWYGLGRERCSACRLPSGWTCDWRRDDGQRCARPMCWRHRTERSGIGDLCPEHALAVEQVDPVEAS
jgi:hypothetical protein